MTRIFKAIKNVITKYYPYLIFGFVSLLIMFPLYKPGLLFLLDFVWSPPVNVAKIYPTGFDETTLLVYIYQLLNNFLPAEVIQKTLLTLIIFFSQFSMFKLARGYMDKRWAVVSGLMYLLNPFFYERFLAGHTLVLLGYLLLPFFIKSSLTFLSQPTRKHFILPALLFCIYPLVDLHYWYISSVLTALLSVVFMIAKRRKWLTYAKFLPILALAFIVVNIFWIVFRIGHANTFTTISLSDFQAYKTSADPRFGVFFNVLSLYGFWGAIATLPKDIFPYWFVITPVLLLLAFVGVRTLIPKRDPLTITLIIAFLPALLISVGYGSPYTQPLINFLYYHLYGFKGLRETEKVVGVLALTYAFFVPLGWQSLVRRLPKASLYGQCLFVGAVAIPFLMTNTILFGFSGQIQPAYYPAGWYTVNGILQKEKAKTVLFLPWHGYMEFPFSQQRIIDNPATLYFNGNVIAGQGFDNVHLYNSQADWNKAVSDMVSKQHVTTSTKAFLQMKGVTDIIIAKTADRESYTFITNEPFVQKVYEDNDIILLKLNGS